MAVTKKRFIARLAPPPCGGRSGPGPRADIARPTDPYDGQSPPCMVRPVLRLAAARRRQVRQNSRTSPAGGSLTLKIEVKMEVRRRWSLWRNEAPDRAIYGFTPSQHASGRVVDQVHVVEAGGEPHAGALARAGSGTHAPAHVDAVDAEEHQRFHAQRLGDLDRGVDGGGLRLAVGLAVGQMFRAQAKRQPGAAGVGAVAGGARW